MADAMLYGFFNRGNLGDDIMLTQIRGRFQRSFETVAELSLPSPSIEGLSRFFRTARKCDSAFLIGGTHFDASSSLGYEISTFKHLVLALLLRSQGCNIHFIGVGIDAPPSFRSRLLLKVLASQVTKVLVRDANSASVATECGFQCVSLASDPIFASPLAEYGDPTGDTVLLCPTDAIATESLVTSIPADSQKIRIAAIFNPVEGKGDLDSSLSLAAALRSSGEQREIELVAYKGDPTSDALWADVSTVVSGRYHVELMATAAGLQVVQVGRSQKFLTLPSEAEIEGCFDVWSLCELLP